MEKAKEEKKKKIKNVPIATIKMDKPVYTVPLQTTMSLNFFFHKSSNPSTNEISPKIALDENISLDSGNTTTKSSTSETYETNTKSNNFNSPVDENISKISLNLEEDKTKISKKLHYTSLNDENSQKNDIKEARRDSKDMMNEFKNNRRFSDVYGEYKDGDSDGELDVKALAERSKRYKSTFKHMTWRLPSPKNSLRQPSSSIILKDSEIVVMIKMTCCKEETLKSHQVQSFMLDVAENCARRLKQMANMDLPDLTPKHMDSLPLNDQRPAQTHLLSLSEQLQDQINLSDIAYRYKSENIYIGTYVSNKVKLSKKCSIGNVGVAAILSRKSKFATIDAFSKQLCRHIASSKPTSLGCVSDAEIRKINKKGTVKIKHLQKDQLMLQDFSFDNTIIVAEAARRSFVKIEDFLLFH